MVRLLVGKNAAAAMVTIRSLVGDWAFDASTKVKPFIFYRSDNH